MNNVQYLAFFIVLISFEIRNIKKTKKISFFSIVNIFYSIYFGLTPYILYNFDFNHYYFDWELPAIIRHFLNNKSNGFIAFFIIVLSYLLILLGCQFGKRIKRRKRNITISKRKIYILGITTLIVSSMSLLFYSIKLGGPIASIQLAETYRAINSNSNQDGWLIIRIFFPLIMCSFFSFFILRLESRNMKANSKFRFKVSMLLFISFLFYLYYLGISASRSKIIVFFVCIYLTIAKKVDFKLVISLCVLGIIFILFGDDLLLGRFNAIMNGSYIKNISKFAIQTSFPFINLLNIDKIISLINIRYFSDIFFVWIINLTPTFVLSLLGISKIKPLWNYSTQFYHSYGAGIPIDFISFGMIEGNLLGLSLISFIFGWFISWLNNFLYGNEYYIKYLRVRTYFLIFNFLANSEPEIIIRGNLDYILMLLVLLFFSKSKKSEHAV